MLHFPHVQRAAQNELDAVVGRARVPEFGDWENLPYIEAVVREAYRWLPVAPLGE